MAIVEIDHVPIGAIRGLQQFAGLATSSVRRGSTVRGRPDLNSWWDEVRLLALARVPWVLASATMTAILAAVIGSVLVGTPSASAGGNTVSFIRLLTVVSGTLPVLILASPSSLLEEAATHAPRVMEAWLVIMVTGYAVLTLCAATFVAMGVLGLRRRSPASALALRGLLRNGSLRLLADPVAFDVVDPSLVGKVEEAPGNRPQG